MREHVLGQWTDLLSTIEHAVSDGTIGQHGLELIQAAAAELERVHQMWKQTHWRLADKMIGEDRGTGYTEGVPYLKDALENRLFSRLLGSLSPHGQLRRAGCPGHLRMDCAIDGDIWVSIRVLMLPGCSGVSRSRTGRPRRWCRAAHRE